MKDAKLVALVRRQACSCPSHSDVLSHACCQACVELCLLEREGPVLGSVPILYIMPWRNSFPCHRMCCGPETLLWFALSVFRVADKIGIDGHVSFLPPPKKKKKKKKIDKGSQELYCNDHLADSRDDGIVTGLYGSTLGRLQTDCVICRGIQGCKIHHVHPLWPSPWICQIVIDM